MKKLILALLCASAFNAHAQVQANVGVVVQASDGTPLNINQLAQTIAYTTCGGNSVAQTITVKWGQGTYVQTITYDGSCNVTNVSAWVKQ